VAPTLTKIDIDQDQLTRSKIIMGYDTRIFGGITITPPLNFAKIKNSPFRSVSREDTTLMFDEDSRVEETDEGTLSKTSAVGIKVRYDETGRHYGIDAELTKIVDAYPDHEFEGGFVSVGADPGDIRRVRVERVADPGRGMMRRVIEEKAELRWPDGSKIEF
jgi:hypothetical protein